MTPKVRVQHTSLLFSTSDTWSDWNQVTWMVFYWGGFWWKDLDKLHSLLVFSQMLKNWQDSTSWCKWILTKHFVKVTRLFLSFWFLRTSLIPHIFHLYPLNIQAQDTNTYIHTCTNIFFLLYKFAISHNDIAKFCNLEYLWCWNTGRDSKRPPHK